MNTNQRRARRNADRAHIEALWRLGGPEAARAGAVQLGRSVRCPECHGRWRGLYRAECPCCQGAGVMKGRERRTAPSQAFPGNPGLDASRMRWLKGRKQ